MLTPADLSPPEKRGELWRHEAGTEQIIEEEIMKRVIIGILTLVLATLPLVGCGGAPASVPDDTLEPAVEEPEVEPEPTEEEPKPEPAKEEPEPEPTVEEPEPALDRGAMIEIFKDNASAAWGEDYEMVKYEVDNQTEAYDWVTIQTAYPDIMRKAEDKWYPDYEMVKYEYENQVGAYEWIMHQTAYLDIMREAKQKWGDDYEMVKYEYENQVEAYEALQ